FSRDWSSDVCSSDLIDLPFGAGLRLTTLRYYTPGGHAIQAQGIHPDVVLEPTLLRDRGSPLLREQDLENHLPAEGAKPPTANAPVHTRSRPATSDEVPGISPTHLGVARIAPDHPPD